MYLREFVQIAFLDHHLPAPSTLFNTSWPIPRALLVDYSFYSVSETFKQATLTQLFLADVAQMTDITEDVRQVLQTHYLPLLVCMLAVPSEETLMTTILDLSLPTENDDIVAIVIRDFQRDLTKFYLDPDSHGMVLRDIRELLSNIEKREILCLSYDITLFNQEIKGIPSYIPVSMRKRLTLLAFHPEYLRVKHILQSMRRPMPYSLPDEPNRETLHPRVFDFLIDPLPEVTEIKGTIMRYNEHMWNMHLTPPESISKNPLLKNIKFKKTPFTFTAKELLEQVLILMCRNWKAIWRHRRWPLTRDIERRLRYLVLHEECTRLKPGEAIYYLLLH